MKYHIFDLDGTLADSMQQWAGKMLNILKINGVTSYPDDIIRIITPLGDRGTAEYFINELGVKMTVDEVIAYMDKYALDEYAYRIPLKDGVKEYLEKLKANGEYLGVLTASPHRFLDVCLKRNGVFDLFDGVWSIEDFGTLTKNNTEIYFEAAKRIGCKNSDIIFYDDNIVAVTTAKRAGLEVIGVFDKASESDMSAISAVADKFIMSFSELTSNGNNQ